MRDTTELRIHLFGTVEAATCEGAVSFPSRKASWLLAILALRNGSPIERQALAAMLWPDSTDPGALHNLRQTLVGLRRALGPAGRLIETIGARSILLRSGPWLWVDAIEFDRAATRGADYRERAVENYRAPLLADCDEPFARIERESREQAFLVLAERLGDDHRLAGRHAEAASIARRILAVDPFRESALRGLMASLAAAGGVGAALDEYRKYEQFLRRELGVEPTVETKALVRAIRSETTKGVLRNGLPTSKPLPHPMTPLIGRESEVEAIARRLPYCPLMTLTGVGGVGKTRLALATAEAAFPGAAFVDLATVTDPASITPAVARALSLVEVTDRTSVDAIADRLRTENRLVILDNCEHLREGPAEFLGRLFAQEPGIRVLATSRQPVGVAGEVVWPVAPLAAPEPNATPDEWLGSPAFRLFLERSSAAGNVRSWHEGERRQIASICRRLDGLPLAIELAAARTNVLSVEEIEARLGDRFAILGGGNRSVPRHQTLRATMDWSWGLVGEPERRLLERMSAFRGGATLGAIEATVGVPALDLLADLVDRSLVIAQRHPSGSRYTTLETVRQYAAERLKEAGDDEAARIGHAAFFSEWAERETRHPFGEGEGAAFERLERDHDNLRAVLEWYRSTGDREAELRLATRLSRFWDTHGHLSEGRGILERALGGETSGLPPSLVADAHDHAGWMATVQRDCEAARDHYAHALAYFRAVGDKPKIAHNLNCLGGANYYAGDYATAQRQYEEALMLFREAGRLRGAATVLANQGELALKMNDPAKARTCFEASFAESGGPEQGGAEERALTFSGLALTDLRQGRFAEARANALRSLQLFDEAQAIVSVPHAIGLLGVMEASQGGWNRAARLLAAETSLASNFGVPLLDLFETERAEAWTGALLHLGPDGTRAEADLGRSMTRDEAIAFALEGSPSPPGP